MLSILAAKRAASRQSLALGILVADENPFALADSTLFRMACAFLRAEYDQAMLSAV